MGFRREGKGEGREVKGRRRVVEREDRIGQMLLVKPGLEERLTDEIRPVRTSAEEEGSASARHSLIPEPSKLTTKPTAPLYG